VTDKHDRNIFLVLLVEQKKITTPKKRRFWKEISALSQLGQTGSSVILGNGQDTAFWLDRWVGDCALSSQFHHLFQICEDPLI
jgi:hypothetical protein